MLYFIIIYFDYTTIQSELEKTSFSSSLQTPYKIRKSYEFGSQLVFPNSPLKSYSYIA